MASPHFGYSGDFAQGVHAFADAREHHVGLTVHAFMSAADDVRRLSDNEVRESAADLDLTVAILLTRLGRVRATADTS